MFTAKYRYYVLDADCHEIEEYCTAYGAWVKLIPPFAANGREACEKLHAKWERDFVLDESGLFASGIK